MNGAEMAGKWAGMRGNQEVPISLVVTFLCHRCGTIGGQKSLHTRIPIDGDLITQTRPCLQRSRERPQGGARIGSQWRIRGTVVSESQSDARADRIAALKSNIDEFRRERRRILGTVATVRLDPESIVTLDNRLRTIRGNLLREQGRLFDLENALD